MSYYNDQQLKRDMYRYCGKEMQKCRTPRKMLGKLEQILTECHEDGTVLSPYGGELVDRLMLMLRDCKDTGKLTENELDKLEKLNKMYLDIIIPRPKTGK